MAVPIMAATAANQTLLPLLKTHSRNSYSRWQDGKGRVTVVTLSCVFSGALLLPSLTE
jgi:hypothetical protein